MTYLLKKLLAIPNSSSSFSRNPFFIYWNSFWPFRIVLHHFLKIIFFVITFGKKGTKNKHASLNSSIFKNTRKFLANEANSCTHACTKLSVENERSTFSKLTKSNQRSYCFFFFKAIIIISRRLQKCINYFLIEVDT